MINSIILPLELIISNMKINQIFQMGFVASKTAQIPSTASSFEAKAISPIWKRKEKRRVTKYSIQHFNHVNPKNVKLKIYIYVYIYYHVNIYIYIYIAVYYTHSSWFLRGSQRPILVNSRNITRSKASRSRCSATAPGSRQKSATTWAGVQWISGGYCRFDIHILVISPWKL